MLLKKMFVVPTHLLVAVAVFVAVAVASVAAAAAVAAGEVYSAEGCSAVVARWRT